MVANPAGMKPALASAALLTALAAVAVPSHAAAPKPQVVDAKGDAIGMQAGTDIVSALFTQTKQAGKPVGFTVALTLAGPPSTMEGLNFLLTAETTTCGSFGINWSPNTALGSRDQITMPCGEVDGTTGEPYTIINVAPVTKGNTLTWTFKRKMFPKELRQGDTFTDLTVAVQQNEPVTGILGPSVFTTVADYDGATGNASFTW